MNEEALSLHTSRFHHDENSTQRFDTKESDCDKTCANSEKQNNQAENSHTEKLHKAHPAQASGAIKKQTQTVKHKTVMKQILAPDVNVGNKNLSTHKQRSATFQTCFSNDLLVAKQIKQKHQESRLLQQALSFEKIDPELMKTHPLCHHNKNPSASVTYANALLSKFNDKSKTNRHFQKNATNVATAHDIELHRLEQQIKDTQQRYALMTVFQ